MKDDPDGSATVRRPLHGIRVLDISTVYAAPITAMLLGDSGPREDELHWARDVLEAFENANGSALRLPGGEFVDLPVAERARKILRLAESLPS